MSFIKHLLAISLLLISAGLLAQPVINSVTGTTSRCLKSGSLTASVSGGTGTLQYSLIAPSIETRPNQVSNVFSALAPGKYTIVVVDVNSQKDTATYTVKGDYVIPKYTYTSKATTCLKANGGFNVNKTLGGRAPFFYKVVAGPDTTNWQSSNSFTGMASGVYTVAITDSCGNTKNLSITVKDTFTYGLQAGSDSYRDVPGNCDSFEMRFFAHYGIGPLKYRIIDGTDTFKFSKNQFVRLKMGKNYKYEVEDACGTLLKRELNYKKVLSINPEYFCNAVRAEIRPYYYGWQDFSSCYKYGVINKNTNVAIWQSSRFFTISPNVLYDFYAIDTCCNDTFIVERSFNLKKDLKSQIIGVSTNLDSTAGVRLLNYSTTYPYYTILLKSSFTSSDTFVTTTDQDKQGKYPFNYNDGDTLGFYTNYISDFSNLPKGKYTFRVVDTCGISDTIEVEILESDLTKHDLKYRVLAGCPSGHSIAYSIANNKNVRPTTKFYQLSPSISSLDISLRIKNPILYDTFNSLSAGTYLIILSNYRGATLMVGSGTETISDTIVIKDPGYPLLEPPITYTCRNGSSSVITKANGGSKPYSYRIQKTGTSTWSSPQNSGEFHGLSSGIYRIEVTDSCGNTNVLSSSSGLLTAPVLKLGFTCDSDTLTLFGNENYGVKYRWFKGTTQISTYLSHSFKPYTTSDYGTYKLQAYINNSNGVCVDTSASITIGPNIEVRSEDQFSCDSFKHKNNWIKKTGFFKDTLQSIGGCDSVAITKVYLGHKVFLSVDSVNCDSSFVFGDWYFNSQTLYDTLGGRGYHLDSLGHANFETNPSGWTLNNCAISTGNAKSGTKKVIFNGPNDWMEFPSVNYPDQLVYDYQLSSLNFGGNKMKVQYHNGSVWVDIEEKDLTSSIYERHVYDLSAVQDSLNVRLRIKQSSPATSALSYIDNVFVTNTSVECDTIVELNLTINKSIKKDDHRTECDSAYVNGKWFFTTQNILDTLSTISGCDSFVTTYLTINPTKVTTVNTTVCDSGRVNGNMYYVTQLVKDSFTSYLNCDSVVHTHLIVNLVKRTYESQTDCDSSLVQGKWYYSTQTINDTFTSFLKCDSIVITDLTINYTEVTPISLTECDSSLIHGKWYFSTQEVRDTFTTYLNCDSVVVTDLIINPTKITTINTMVCDSGRVNGNMYYVTQLVTDNLKTQNGCDSIVKTNLEVRKSFIRQYTDTFCGHYNYELNDGGIVYEPGIYQSVYSTYQNCDSIIEVNLIEKDCSPCTVFFPNAFTPNGNNRNDGFKREGTCTFTKYELSIFNRWGELLFYTQDPDAVWDGSFSGVNVDQGVYFYSCYYINTEGKAEHLYHDLTLIK